MSVPLYFDENIQLAVALGLQMKSVDVITTHTDQMNRRPDIAVMDRATQLGRPIFTHDKDFLAEANRRQKEGIQFSGVIFAQEAMLSIGEMVQYLHLIAECGTPEEFANKVIYLPL